MLPRPARTQVMLVTSPKRAINELIETAYRLEDQLTRVARAGDRQWRDAVLADIDRDPRANAMRGVHRHSCYGCARRDNGGRRAAIANAKNSSGSPKRWPLPQIELP